MCSSSWGRPAAIDLPQGRQSLSTGLQLVANALNISKSTPQDRREARVHDPPRQQGGVPSGDRDQDSEDRHPWQPSGPCPGLHDPRPAQGAQ